MYLAGIVLAWHQYGICDDKLAEWVWMGGSTFRSRIRNKCVCVLFYKKKSLEKALTYPSSSSTSHYNHQHSNLGASAFAFTLADDAILYTYHTVHIILLERITTLTDTPNALKTSIDSEIAERRSVGADKWKERGLIQGRSIMVGLRVRWTGTPS